MSTIKVKLKSIIIDQDIVNGYADINKTVIKAIFAESVISYCVLLKFVR